MRRWASRVLLGLLAALAVYALLAAFADVREVAATLRAFDARALVLALGLVLAAYAVRALRWRLYLHRIGVLAPTARVALGFMAGFAMGLAPGKSGQVVKAYYLRLCADVPYGVSVPATFAERVADTLSMMLLLVVALFLVPGATGRAAVVTALLVLLLLATMRWRGLPRALFAPVRRWPWAQRHEEPFTLAHERLRQEMVPRRLAAPALIGLSGFLFEVLALQALAERGLGLPLPFGVAAFAIALADLAAVVTTFIPGGIGVAEGGLLVVLTLHGFSLPHATALTLLFRLATLWFGLLLGALSAGALQAMHARGARRRRPTQG